MKNDFLARVSAAAGAFTTALTTPKAATPILATPAPSIAASLQITTSLTPDLIEIKVDGLDAAKANATWLTKGKDRTQPTTSVKLVDCTTEHLKNIVANKPNLSAGYRRVIEAILEDRGEVLDPTVDHDDVSGFTRLTIVRRLRHQ